MQRRQVQRQIKMIKIKAIIKMISRMKKSNRANVIAHRSCQQIMLVAIEIILTTLLATHQYGTIII